MSTREQYETALRLLESPGQYPGLLKRPGARVLVRLWCYPSFHPYSSWAIVKASEHFFLRRVTWDQSHTLSLTPVTYGAEAPIEATLFEPLLNQLRGIQLPPFLSVATVGIDGTSYGVEIGSFSVSAKLSWWQTPPQEWAALASWHSTAVAEFEALLPASTPGVSP